MSSTGIANGAMRLCVCYAMPGTDLAYGHTRSRASWARRTIASRQFQCVSAYALDMRSLALIQRDVVWVYACAMLVKRLTSGMQRTGTSQMEQYDALAHGMQHPLSANA
eukprot:3940643-Rhodomonas_salina.5